jgi:hypothetical protein
MEILRTRAKARLDEIYRFITHIPAAIGMSMSARREKELKIVSICNQTGLMTSIVVKRLCFPFKWLRVDMRTFWLVHLP